MRQPQWIASGVAFAFTLVLYFGFSTKPSSFREVEASRRLVMTATDAQSLILEARNLLEAEQTRLIMALEQALAENPDHPETLRQLSSAWFAAGHEAIAGHYARLVAESEGTAEAWAIAGTTYLMGLQRSKEEKVRRFCRDNALEALERAISLEPEVVRHRLNLALVHTEMPSGDNPMQGVLMLVDLNKKHPEDAGVLFHLGRLALQTGQTAKAVERLEEASSLRPEHPDTWALLAAALEQAGDKTGAAEARQRYETLIKEPK